MKYDPIHLLCAAPNAEVARVVIANSDVLAHLARRGALPEVAHDGARLPVLPAPVVEYLTDRYRTTKAPVLFARMLAASATDPELLTELLSESRVTVQREAVVRCHNLGHDQLIAASIPGWEPPSQWPSPYQTNYLGPCPRRTPGLDVSDFGLGAVELDDDTMFTRLRRSSWEQIAAWLSSDPGTLNGFRPSVAEMLVGRYPKNQQRITEALVSIDPVFYDRLADWLDKWADHVRLDTLHAWQHRRFGNWLGSNPDVWAVAIGLLPNWMLDTRDLAATAQTLV